MASFRHLSAALLAETPLLLLLTNAPDEVCARFFTSPHRGRLLLGFFKFRAALRTAGILTGYQWIDGSFTEDVERQGRHPADIDVVSFLYRPMGMLGQPTWSKFVQLEANGGIFDRGANRGKYECDTLFVDLNAPPHLVAKQAAYWNGLFSHQRATFQWKGMLSLALALDDGPALSRLAAGGIT